MAFGGARERRGARDWFRGEGYDLFDAECFAALMRKQAREDGIIPDAPEPEPVDPSIRPARPGDLEARDAANRCLAALDAQAEAEELEAKGDPEAPRARLRADALKAEVFAPPSRKWADAARRKPGPRAVRSETRRTVRRSGTGTRSSSSGSEDADCEGEPEPPFVWPARFDPAELARWLDARRTTNSRSLPRPARTGR